MNITQEQMVNKGRLIDATLKLPVMLEFTQEHIEQELKPFFIKNNKLDKLQELQEKLCNY